MELQEVKDFVNDTNGELDDKKWNLLLSVFNKLAELFGSADDDRCVTAMRAAVTIALDDLDVADWLDIIDSDGRGDRFNNEATATIAGAVLAEAWLNDNSVEAVAEESGEWKYIMIDTVLSKLSYVDAFYPIIYELQFRGDGSNKWSSVKFQ